MSTQDIIAILTIVLAFASTTITIVLRYKLIEMGKDIKELKAQVLKTK
jgi:hypothetical protein